MSLIQATTQQCEGNVNLIPVTSFELYLDLLYMKHKVNVCELSSKTYASINSPLNSHGKRDRFIPKYSYILCTLSINPCGLWSGDFLKSTINELKTRQVTH